MKAAFINLLWYLPALTLVGVGVALLLVGHLMAGGWTLAAGIVGAFSTDSPESSKKQ